MLLPSCLRTHLPRSYLQLDCSRIRLPWPRGFFERAGFVQFHGGGARLAPGLRVQTDLRLLSCCVGVLKGEFAIRSEEEERALE